MWRAMTNYVYTYMGAELAKSTLEIVQHNNTTLLV